uniref:Retrovirus-related Pol polyprotein from transposon TNT 1-94 n=1 Tax=Tanacetum cinerariifolium TaxID=118510 RepID=A0A6L2LBU9_TANCI|nr:hypothetical protein [Tanacetum cinerariifolium]
MINQSPRGIFINQAKYAQEILQKHGMTSCDSVSTPMATKHLDADLSGTSVNQTKYRSMVGALMYLTASRPDIVHATCYCAHYQAKPIEKHLTAVKRIFRYLKDTINLGIWYAKDIGFELTAFLNLDHAGCLDSRKSTSGGIQFLDYGFHFDKIPMYCDSKAAIAILCNPVHHSRTKHINVRYHFIKEKVEKGIVELFFVGTKYQLADLFTKALYKDRFKYLVRRLANSRYAYDYLSEIVLRRADLQKHTIAEKDFKNMYPSDFEDLNLLLLQGHLDHLPNSDKQMLFAAVKLWTRNLVIRQRYEFKHDYTIIESSRAVVFPFNNIKRKIMRVKKIYKFSDGTLTRILEALAYRVKEFKIKQSIWNLECFVGGRVRDIDYGLLQRME